MSTVAFVGDCTTTTVLAVAAGWPAGGVPDSLIVECDPTGGSLAAWLDLPATPSLSTAVTALHQSAAGRGTIDRWRTIEPMLRRSDAGPRVLVAPTSAREARSALGEAHRAVFPALAAQRDVVLLDAGRIDADVGGIAQLGAEHVVLVHRQHDASARAAAVRLERAAETVSTVTGLGLLVSLVVIGDEPFDLDEVVDFVAPGGASWLLPDDRLAAAVLAGRSGVSARRLARLPLMRAAAAVASDLAAGVVHDAAAGRTDAGADGSLQAGPATATATSAVAP